MVTIAITDQHVDVDGTDADDEYPFTNGHWSRTLTSGGQSVRVSAYLEDQVVVHHTADGSDELPPWAIEGDGTTRLSIDVTPAQLSA